jgi:hypothetical protein
MIKIINLIILIISLTFGLLSAKSGDITFTMFFCTIAILSKLNDK